MSKKNSSSAGSGGFLGLLTLLFIGLKLTGHISWSWLWVLSPIWMPSVIVLLFLAFAFGIAWLVAYLETRKD